MCDCDGPRLEGWTGKIETQRGLCALIVSPIGSMTSWRRQLVFDKAGVEAALTNVDVLV